MNAKRFLRCLVLTLVLCLMFVPVMASAKANVKHCSGTEVLIQVVNPGVWTNPDGNIHVRGMVSEYIEQMNCPESSGINTVIMNANWDANYVGPIWGTSNLETSYSGGGVWKVSWSGKTNPDGTFYYKGTGKGISGSVTGLKIKVYGYSNEPNGTTFIETTIRYPGDK
jgi:hypothetical protein